MLEKKFFYESSCIASINLCLRRTLLLKVILLSSARTDASRLSRAGILRHDQLRFLMQLKILFLAYSCFLACHADEACLSADREASILSFIRNAFMSTLCSGAIHLFSQEDTKALSLSLRVFVFSWHFKKTIYYLSKLSSPVPAILKVTILSLPGRMALLCK